MLRSVCRALLLSHVQNRAKATTRMSHQNMTKWAHTHSSVCTYVKCKSQQTNVDEVSLRACVCVGTLTCVSCVLERRKKGGVSSPYVSVHGQKSVRTPYVDVGGSSCSG